jgi:hypothetical protein
VNWCSPGEPHAGVGSGTFAHVLGGVVRSGAVSVGATVVALLFVAACSSGSPAGSGVTTVPHTGPTDDLAPSQLTAPTVPPPDVPPPCDPATLTIWTAQVLAGGGWADAVLRVRNDGDEWCEVDVAGSPSVDPAMEPDVWLDPGAWADLVLGSPEGDCAAPAAIRLAEIDVNGAKVVVETAAVVPCGWRLTAFYPNRTSDEQCTELGVAAVDGAVVVRNDGPGSCRLGSLSSVAGEGVTAVPAAAGVAVPVLASGDLVALELGVDGDCGVRPVDLAFDTGVIIQVPVSGCEVSVGSGAPQPWIGGPGSPTADDPASLLGELDPFGDDA